MSALQKIKSAVGAVTGTAAPPVDLAELQKRKATADAALAEFQSTYAAAALSVEIHPGDPQAETAFADARKAREHLRDRVNTLGEAIKAQQVVNRMREEAEAAAELKRRWDLTEALAESRVEIAKQVEKAWATIAKGEADLVQLCEDIRVASPVALEPKSTISNPLNVVAVIRLQGVKAGSKWAFNWPWPPAKLPTLEASIHTANAEIAIARKKATAKKG